MKKIIFILATFFTLQNSRAQTPLVTDTVGYLKTVFQHKENYIGRQFSVLLDSLKVPIRYFSPSGRLTYDISKETSSGFYFSIPKTADAFGKRYITIYWQSYLNATVSDQIFTNSDGWNNDARNFYKNAIVKSIYVSDDIKNYDPNAVPPPRPRWIVVSCVYKKVMVDDLNQWRYEIIKRYCNNGNLGTETQVTLSTTKVEIESCGVSLSAE